jgi:hypothetical protein
MMTSLQPLAKYAHAPATDAPPELLPADPAHEWGVENAARGALGLLVAGEAPSERLFQVADYLLTFCPSGYHRGQLPDSELLNGTALALCGYVCHGAHPEAELWRLTGCARLATELHKRKAALEDQLAADCLFAVCLVADELEAPVLADIVSLRERMWGSPQDQSRVELLHVSEEEYPSHMTDPAPVDQVGAMVAERDWQWELRSGAVAGTTDLQAAEEACRDLITLRAHMLVRHQFGSEIDWHLKLFDDVESTVSLGAQPFIRHLARAWEETGDEKFAHHAARMLWSFYQPPADGGPVAHAGGRQPPDQRVADRGRAAGPDGRLRRGHAFDAGALAARTHALPAGVLRAWGELVPGRERRDGRRRAVLARAAPRRRVPAGGDAAAEVDQQGRIHRRWLPVRTVAAVSHVPDWLDVRGSGGSEGPRRGAAR